jgi:hypothetical protein
MVRPPATKVEALFGPDTQRLRGTSQRPRTVRAGYRSAVTTVCNSVELDGPYSRHDGIDDPRSCINENNLPTDVGFLNYIKSAYDCTVGHQR